MSDGRDPGDATTGTPGWVKVFAVIFLLLVLLVAVMVAMGHGPGRHMHTQS